MLENPIHATVSVFPTDDHNADPIDHDLKVLIDAGVPCGGEYPSGRLSIEVPLATGTIRVHMDANTAMCAIAKALMAAE